MKKIQKILAILLTFVLAFCFSAAALAAGENAAGGTMETAFVNVAIDYGVRLVFALLMTLIGVLGTWLAAVTGKSKRMQNVAAAIKELTDAAKVTVGSLQQTVVDGLKAAHADNKLTKEEIAMLGVQLKEKTMLKLSADAYAVLEAASVDIEAWIEDAAEDWIRALKAESGVLKEEVLQTAE